MKIDLDSLRRIADDYCKGEEIPRVLLEEILERFICLADEKLTGSGYVPEGTGADALKNQGRIVRNSIIEQCAKVCDVIANAKSPEPDYMKWDDHTAAELARRIRALHIVEPSTNAAPQAAEQRGPENNPLVIPAEAACVSVPKQPTEDMVASGVHAILCIEGEQAPTRVRVVYRAMLNARPISNSEGKT